jgi:hypothetical protein
MVLIDNDDKLMLVTFQHQVLPLFRQINATLGDQTHVWILNYDYDEADNYVAPFPYLIPFTLPNLDGVPEEAYETCYVPPPPQNKRDRGVPFGDNMELHWDRNMKKLKLNHQHAVGVAPRVDVQ